MGALRMKGLMQAGLSRPASPWAAGFNGCSQALSGDVAARFTTLQTLVSHCRLHVATETCVHVTWALGYGLWSVCEQAAVRGHTVHLSPA